MASPSTTHKDTPCAEPLTMPSLTTNHPSPTDAMPLTSDDINPGVKS